MLKIKSIHAREILDSRGNPTVECDIITSDGCSTASVPSGASVGFNEAWENRDERNKRYHGKGVQTAVANINKIIARKIAGMDAANQQAVDSALLKLDPTAQKVKLGANALLAVSMACCRAASPHALYENVGKLFGTKKYILPVPAFNIINGGKHAGNTIDLQEYMILPVGAKSFSEALQIGAEVYQTLKTLLLGKFGKSAINVGDEGGFAPPMTCIEEPFDMILDAVNELGYLNKVKLGIDCAASTLYSNGHYKIEDKALAAHQLLDRYEELAASYPIISIEDPFAEEDFEHFSLLTKTAKKFQVVADDLTATNPERIKSAAAEKAANCLLLKMNQIGTVTEALEAGKIAKKAGWNIMVSHRSGETTDDFIADLAVGIACGQIKSGAPCRGERIAKYNRLLRIEETLGKKAHYTRRFL
ncbi:MAG: phosphopyruvate hydratase [Candidatus Aenigmarchaeota archaeon]|nr:phosphopyruvate hydratase [Candidatus Aenigmarchaeota archaeon]